MQRQEKQLKKKSSQIIIMKVNSAYLKIVGVMQVVKPYADHIFRMETD